MSGYIDTERALICACVLGSKDTQEWVASELTFKDFSSLEHQRAFKAITSILDEALEVNSTSVKDRGKLSVAAMDAILSAGQHSPEEVRTFLKDVKRASVTRQLSQVFQECQGLLKDTDDPFKVLEQLESKLYGTSLSGAAECEDAEDLAAQAIADFEARCDGGGERYLSTGLKDLDKAIIGYLPGQNIVVGARPGNGKSAFATTEAQIAIEQGVGVLIFSREMTGKELMNRMIAAKTGVGVRKIKTGRNVTPEERGRVKAAQKAFPREFLRVSSKCNSLQQIARVARMEKARMARKGIKLGLIIIDYLQLFCESEEHTVISQASKLCKLLAMDMECTVLTLSQLNRSLEYREDKRPLPSDLRGSGSIEQDADVILFLFRPWQYDKAQDEEYTEVIVAKQRDGPQGPVVIRFLPKVTLFTDWQTNDAA
jgi:replicative DNA helicase